MSQLATAASVMVWRRLERDRTLESLAFFASLAVTDARQRIRGASRVRQKPEMVTGARAATSWEGVRREPRWVLSDATRERAKIEATCILRPLSRARRDG